MIVSLSRKDERREGGNRLFVFNWYWLLYSLS
jgi:hypothetical protein